MAVPPKRRSSRSGRRAAQTGRTTPPATEAAPAINVPLDTSGDGAQWIAAPPRTGCPPWHFYWCDGHDDWHHHTEPAIHAIEADFPTS